MTRKHFQAIAGIISLIDDDATRTMVARNMANKLEGFNPAFGWHRFQVA